ncbi:MAG TPA: hypothetical protein IAB43_10715 [Candidatus Spyradocola merdavium]|nr:hypothetical protein [Candidatus Spyradocola merdavium]
MKSQAASSTSRGWPGSACGRTARAIAFSPRFCTQIRTRNPARFVSGTSSLSTARESSPYSVRKW